MLTWLAAQSGVSGRQASHRQWQAKFSHPFTHFSQMIQRAHLLSPLTLDDTCFKHKTMDRSEEITLIKSCASVVSSTEPDGHFLPHLTIFVLYFKGPGIGFPVRGSWKWPNCLCRLFVFPYCQLPEGEFYYSIVHQCVACPGPGLWDWAGEHILLCVGVMNMSRPWALVWEKIRKLQCVFSLWLLLDPSGIRPMWRLLSETGVMWCRAGGRNWDKRELVPALLHKKHWYCPPWATYQLDL